MGGRTGWGCTGANPDSHPRASVDSHAFRPPSLPESCEARWNSGQRLHLTLSSESCGSGECRMLFGFCIVTRLRVSVFAWGHIWVWVGAFSFACVGEYVFSLPLRKRPTVCCALTPRFELRVRHVCLKPCVCTSAFLSDCRPMRGGVLPNCASQCVCVSGPWGGGLCCCIQAKIPAIVVLEIGLHARGCGFVVYTWQRRGTQGCLHRV